LLRWRKVSPGHASPPRCCAVRKMGSRRWGSSAISSMPRGDRADTLFRIPKLARPLRGSKVEVAERSGMRNCVPRARHSERVEGGRGPAHGVALKLDGAWAPQVFFAMALLRRRQRASGCTLSELCRGRLRKNNDQWPSNCRTQHIPLSTFHGERSLDD